MSSSPTPPILNRFFFNLDESRLRSGWRIVLHSTIWMSIGLVFAFAYLITGGSLDVGLGSEGVSLRIVDGATILLATWIARRFLDKRSFLSLGFQIDRSTIGDFLFGLGLAFLLIGVIFLFELSMGWLTIEGWAGDIYSGTTIAREVFAGLVIFALGSLSEETLSRGYHLQNLMEGLPLLLALTLSAGIFSSIHLLNPHANLASTIGVLAAGYFLSLGWLWTGRLWLPIAFHLGWNFFQGIVFGFPVSGFQTFHLLQHSVEGPDLITGGSFGPEAGLVVLPVLAVGAVLMRIYSKHRERRNQNSG